ncbi:MAG TPA: GAF domain-containing protein [Thermoanaerobaculia bacterium]|nr:GAF domain-containing protein [Thermoanaerobaculia bacterium]
MSHETSHPSYIDRVRDDTQRYMRYLLTENEQLRSATAHLETELSGLRQELSQRRDAERELGETLERIRAEGQKTLARYAEVEMHNANLANLYVTSYQLHGTLQRHAILESLQEVVVNLIGSEAFAICEISGDELNVAAAVGVEPSAISWATPHVRHAVETRTLYVAGGDRNAGEPLVCVPLQVDDERVGVIVILGLLAHKPGLEPLDHELFDLFATHASMALYCSRLQQRVREVAFA